MPPTATTVLPTATRVAALPPTAAAAPRAVSEICPGWFTPPEPGKGVLVVQAFWPIDVEIQSPYSQRVGQLEPAGDDPGRQLLQLAPGHYEVVYSGDGSALNVFDIHAGDMLGTSLWHDARGRVTGTLHADMFPFEPPAGCPGAIPAVTLPPQCPAWYAKPEQGKGLYVIENFINAKIDIVGVKGISDGYAVPPKVGDKTGWVQLMLAEGHYEFDVKYGTSDGHITFDIAAGQSLYTGLSFSTKSTIGQLGASPLVIPAGCAGSVSTSTPAAPTAQCPEWYVPLEPGKGMLVVENWLGQNRYARNAELLGLEAITARAEVPMMANGNPGRLVLMLPPGHYHFDTRYPSGASTFDIAAGQRLVVPLSDRLPMGQFSASELISPPGCK
jgi:hypothetical protein